MRYTHCGWHTPFPFRPLGRISPWWHSHWWHSPRWQANRITRNAVIPSLPWMMHHLYQVYSGYTDLNLETNVPQDEQAEYIAMPRFSPMANALDPRVDNELLTEEHKLYYRFAHSVIIIAFFTVS